MFPLRTRTETQNLDGNSTGNRDKKSTITSKNNETEEERWNMLGRKDKSNTSKTDNTTRRYKPESTGERRKN